MVIEMCGVVTGAQIAAATCGDHDDDNDPKANLQCVHRDGGPKTIPRAPMIDNTAGAGQRWP